MISLQFLVHAVETSSVLELCFVKSIWWLLNSINIIPLVDLSKYECQFLCTKKLLLISKRAGNLPCYFNNYCRTKWDISCSTSKTEQRVFIQWCNLMLAQQFWLTKVCLQVSKISEICLPGRLTGQATSWKAIFKNYSRYSLIKWYQFWLI